MFKHAIVFTLATLAVCVATRANAQLTSVGPFTGNLTETFEEFPNYHDNFGPQAEPVSIFGGAASLTSGNKDIVIYEPSAGDGFGLNYNGFAQVADGTKGAGLNGIDTATIVFRSDITQFGGYFGAPSFANPPITLSFYDDSNNLIGTRTYDYNHVGTGDGKLDFVGYASTIGIKTVTIGGFDPVFDGLQANSTSVPEPGNVALLLGVVTTGAGFAARKRRK